MEFKGTEGKWSIKNLNTPEKGKYPALEITISTEEDEAMCTVWYSKVFGKKVCKQQKANALLISKAPEMLEMLIDIKGYLGSDVREKVEQLIKESTKLK
jgi:hypothetical protein